uniref:Chitinase n=1 Tax=Glaciozyma antarctica TaxID=105987 RepID=F8UTU2_9BASI|nr:chitinase [Glaciozyma antarctica]
MKIPLLSSLLLALPLLTHAELTPTTPSSHHDLATRAICPAGNQIGMYWPAWGAQKPAEAPFARSSLAFYVLVVTTANGIALPDGHTTTDVKAFVAGARAVKSKPLLTVGGWTGSVYLSALISTSSKRTAFAKTLLAFVNKHGFDGVDLDWEYIGRQGAGNNIVSKLDSANLAKFVAVLRATFGPKKLLHASLPAVGITGPDRLSLKSTKAFAPYLDYITVMVYDIYGSWSATTGPNAPFAECIGGSSISVQSSITAWLASGFPACKILLGIPTYSYLFSTASNKITTKTYGGKKTLSFQTLGRVAPVDPHTTYKQLIANKWLSADGKVGMSGWTRYWDSCTSTPFLFNPSKKLFLSYDDVTSTGIKASYARKMGLAGVNFYDSTGATTPIFAAAKAGLAGTFKA